MKGGGGGWRKGVTSNIQHTGCKTMDFNEQNLVGVDFKSGEISDINPIGCTRFKLLKKCNSRNLFGQY